MPESLPLVQRLRWDFKTSYPEPTEEAIEAGVVDNGDLEPAKIRSIHEEHARQMLGALRELDAILDAKRRGIDPSTRRAAVNAAMRQRLQKLYTTEPARLEQWFQNLLAVYEESFGLEAAEAFGKTVRAWHAGVEVVTGDSRSASLTQNLTLAQHPVTTSLKENVKSHRRRTRHCLPVPCPLASAVLAGRFGHEEDGRPVRPGAHEIRAITETHAEKLIALLDETTSAPARARGCIEADYAEGIAAYAQDFGEGAADQLKSYVEHQARLGPDRRRTR
jgi:hypothetical protein